MTDTTALPVRSDAAPNSDPFRGPLTRVLEEQLGARVGVRVGGGTDGGASGRPDSVTDPDPSESFTGDTDQGRNGRLEESAAETVTGLAAVVASVIAPPERALPVPRASAWRPELPDPTTLAEMTGRAISERGTPWPQPRASDAARYHGDGDRLAWETPAFTRQERLTRTAIAATRNPAMVADVVDGVILLCEQSSWCWPAHDDTFARHGSVLPTVTDPYLDLGAGEVVGQLAWVDQLLGDQLDAHYPGVRARIRHEARVRVFEPFVRRRDWHWLGLDGDAHNWNPWIHGNVLVAALRLLDGPSERDERARILALVVEGLDRYVAVLPEDGAIDEGYAYWWNGACRLLEALDLLTFATGGAFDPVPSIPALRETVAFPHRMHLGGGWFVNAADGQAKPSDDQPWHSLHRAAVRAGDADAQRLAASKRRPDRAAVVEAEGLGRVLRGMTDAAWLQAQPTVPPAPAATWLPSTQMLVARERGGATTGLTVAVKGGHNNEHHNHNDVGNFLVASNGVPVIVDAGRPSYDARTFSERRYELWPMQSEWHNVPFVAGCGQPTGRQYAAEVVDVRVGGGTDGGNGVSNNNGGCEGDGKSDGRGDSDGSNDGDSSLTLELAGAYDVEGLESWRREVTLDRERSEVRIHDAWSFAHASAAEALAAAHSSNFGDKTAISVQLRLLIAGVVTEVRGGADVTPLGGAPRLHVSWPEGATATLTPIELDDAMLTEVWGSQLVRLDLEVDVANRSSLTVKVRQARSTLPFGDTESVGVTA